MWVDELLLEGVEAARELQEEWQTEIPKGEF